MQDNEVRSLREMLETLPTSQLDKMLHLELQKEPPDPDSVRVILHILEQRDREHKTEPTPQQLAAWERYRQRIAQSSLRPKPARRRLWLRWSMAAACLAVVFFLMIPVRVEAEGFLGTLGRWKSDFLEFLVPGKIRKETMVEYKTDHPGLQQLYDEAVAFGIENPAIPQWFPEEYEGAVSIIVETPVSKRLSKAFRYQQTEAILEIKQYGSETYRQFFKDETYGKTYEKNGIAIDIACNYDRWAVVWYKDKIEYFITIDCQEDMLQQILASIYVMEEG